MATDTMISFRAPEALSAALAEAASRRGITVSEAARTGLQAAYAQPRPVYGPSSPWSFVADSWRATTESNPDAIARLRGGRAVVEAAFALTSATASQVSGPAYDPVAVVEDGARPLHSLCTLRPLHGSTPVGVPALVSGTGSPPRTSRTWHRRPAASPCPVESSPRAATPARSS